MNVRMIRAAAVLSLSTAAVLLTGCSGSGDSRHNQIVSNLTPELQGASQRPVEFSSRESVVTNTAARLRWEDGQRALLLDKPSALQNRPNTW